ncbi:MAG TPA: glycosyltransferase family 2 protein [Bryobacteraceae bacterium]|nr:glycosyltransferase family 2 protein [Bryobacteraceae bacterium]
MSAPGNGSVCAVVVTFNRKQLLRGCVQSLRRQTRPLDEIVIVNNHSTDGTEELLASEFGDLPRIDLAENLGGAGGFHVGMKWAYEHGYEWIWVMDDDIEAYPTTLEAMLAYGDISNFIQLRREEPDGIKALESIWDASACQPVPYGNDISFQDSDRLWISVQFGNFEGALINRAVVNKIGYPDARFFISGDDTIYGFLASFHTNVLYARQVGFRRTLCQPKANTRLSLYLHFRNRFLAREHLLSRGVRVHRKAFWFHTLTELGWAVKDSVRGLGPGWMLKVSAPIQGLRDGIRGRYGRPPWIKA